MVRIHSKEGLLLLLFHVLLQKIRCGKVVGGRRKQVGNRNEENVKK